MLAGALEKVSEGRRSQDYMLGQIEQERDQLDRSRAPMQGAGSGRPTSRWHGCSTNRP
jgi:hypothetical protein